MSEELRGIFPRTYFSNHDSDTPIIYEVHQRALTMIFQFLRVGINEDINSSEVKRLIRLLWKAYCLYRKEYEKEQRELQVECRKEWYRLVGYSLPGETCDEK
jgi:hypothetical protein